MLYVEWCKSHRKVERTTAITACPLCLIEETERLRSVLERIANTTISDEFGFAALARETLGISKPELHLKSQF